MCEFCKNIPPGWTCDICGAKKNKRRWFKAANVPVDTNPWMVDFAGVVWYYASNNITKSTHQSEWVDYVARGSWVEVDESDPGVRAAIQRCGEI